MDLRLVGITILNRDALQRPELDAKNLIAEDGEAVANALFARLVHLIGLTESGVQIMVSLGWSASLIRLGQNTINFPSDK